MNARRGRSKGRQLRRAAREPRIPLSRSNIESNRSTGKYRQQHTPGPWRVMENDNATRTIRVGNRIVAAVWTDARKDGQPIEPLPVEANAHLIASAPDLLAALEAFLRAPSIGSSGPGSISIEIQTFNLDAARAAIAKAKGQL